MHNAQHTNNKYHIIFLFLVVLLMHPKWVIAASPEPTHDIAIVTLAAPESILDFLNQYIELPEQPFATTTAKRAFWRRIQRNIKELLATEGYFTPQLTLQDHWEDDTTPSIISIEPGPLTEINTINIEFIGEIAKKEAKYQQHIQHLLESWLLKEGDPFRSSDWEKAKSALLSEITLEKYAAASIETSKAAVDPDTAQVDLSLIIDSGPAFYFGELDITGLERYSSEIIKNFMLFRVGDPYNREVLHRFQIALQSIPHFKSVSVSITPDTTQYKAAPIHVVVTEFKSQRIAVGAGFSSNNGARGELNFRNHNFFDRAWYLNSTLRLEQKRQTFVAGIDTLPNQNNIQYSLDTSLQRTDIKNLETIKQRVGLTRNFRTRVLQNQIGLIWQRENKRPSGADNQINEALVLDWRWRYHHVDNPLHIRQGNVAEIQIGGGSQHVFSEQDFIRSYGRYQSWWPVGQNDVFFLRAEAGYTLAQSRFGIPQEYLFRAGGIHSVRGYDFNSLGVREGNAIVGGRTLATGTVEYTRWVIPKWGAAVFADLGSAADKWQNMHAFLGYGAGIRWRSPAGPLALDVARSHETGTLRFHFSMAVAF